MIAIQQDTTTLETTTSATIHTGQVEWVLLYWLIMWIQPLITSHVAALLQFFLSWQLAFTVTSGVLSRTWTRLSDKTANGVRCVQIQLPFWAAMGPGLSSGDGKQSGGSVRGNSKRRNQVGKFEMLFLSLNCCSRRIFAEAETCTWTKDDMNSVNTWTHLSGNHIKGVWKVVFFLLFPVNVVVMLTKTCLKLSNLCSNPCK